MCTNQRFIYNPYSRNKVLVKCGKCAACMQEKACGRANRMRNNVLAGQIGLFVTLTFDNKSVPYIKRSEVEDNIFSIRVGKPVKPRYELPIYRDGKVIDSLPLFERLSSDCLSGALDLKKKPDCIGVCYYSDIQKFIKRLRINLRRHYNYDKQFTYFACTEYGGHTLRPHAHLELFIPSEDEELFRLAITEAWPYADKSRTYEYIEVAKDCSTYLSSYVNSNISIPPLLQNPLFRPKHTYSKGFGVLADCFSISSLYEKIQSGNLFYYRESKFDGKTSFDANPIPSYVINRYFPKHKGFGWLTPLQLRTILLCPARSGDVLTDFSFRCRYGKWSIPITRQCKLIHPLYTYTPNETYRIYVSLENAYQRVHKALGINRFDYALLYERVWSLLSLTCLRLSLQGVLFLEDWKDFYYNGADIVHDPYLSLSLTDCVPVEDIQTNPNKLRDVVEKTSRFSDLYSKLDKRRKVTNLVMAHEGYNV